MSEWVAAGPYAVYHLVSDRSMASQDLEEWFIQAAAIAAKVPKNLQEAAFNRALDHLMKGASTPNLSAFGSSSRRRQVSSTDTGAQSDAESLTAKIDRTRHTDVGATSRLADRALKVLELALHDYGIDGLTAGEIAEVLTKTFRLPAKRNAVGMALARERSTANLRREGGKSRFHIMQPGEQYLKRLRDGGLERADEGTKPTGQSRPRKSKKSQSQSADRLVVEPARPRKAPQAARREKGRSGRLGPKAAIEKLIANGFFASPRTISDVREELKHRLGSDFALQELSISLVRLLRSEALQRQRNENNQYEYQL